MIPEPSTVAVETPHVASLLPQTADRPRLARKVFFPLGLVLYWIIPGRVGPHLVVGSFRRALLAHVLSLVAMALVALALVFSTELLPKLQAMETLRQELAMLIFQLALESAGTPWSWMPVVVVLLSVPVFELAFVLLGAMAMPWAAGGDAPLSVFLRSVKNVYWSTTALVLPFTGAALAIADDHRHFLPLDRWNVEIVTLLPAAVLLLLWARCLMVGAREYVGEPKGPAFAPREPRCEGCGYLLIGLPVEASCPECSLPVWDSLPGGRRRPTPWQTGRFRLAGILDLLRLQVTIFFDGGFFKHLPVQSGFAKAWHFWWATYALMLWFMLGFCRVVQAITEQEEIMAPLATAVILLPVALQAIMMVPACLWAQFRHGIRDYRVAATVCYYASAMMWPVLLMLVVVLAVMLSPLPDRLQELRWYRRPLYDLTGMDVFFLAAATWLGVSLWLWWRRISIGFTDVRFANS